MARIKSTPIRFYEIKNVEEFRIRHLRRFLIRKLQSLLSSEPSEQLIPT